MSAFTDIYDFETVFETALKNVFKARSITAYTSVDFSLSNGDGTPIQKLQLKRPRVEIQFSPGEGNGQWHLNTESGETTLREQGWSGEYTVRIVTAARYDAHSAYRAEVRGVLHNLTLLNGTDPMLRHKIQPQSHDGGTSPIVVDTEEGTFTSQIKMAINFSVQTDAWSALTS